MCGVAKMPVVLPCRTHLSTSPSYQLVSRKALRFPGSVMAVVGASGSGKSTIAWLLLRLYDPQRGSVTLDGTDVRRLDPVWLRQQTGVVSQVCRTAGGVPLVHRRQGAVVSRRAHGYYVV